MSAADLHTGQSHRPTPLPHLQSGCPILPSQPSSCNWPFLSKQSSTPFHSFAAAAAAKLLQSSNGSAVPGILQARTLEWVAISFSNAWKWRVKVKSLSRVRLLATPWTAAHEAPPSMGFARQEYWSGVPLPSLNPLLKLTKSSPDPQAYTLSMVFKTLKAALPPTPGVLTKPTPRVFSAPTTLTSTLPWAHTRRARPQGLYTPCPSRWDTPVSDNHKAQMLLTPLTSSKSPQPYS